MSTAASSTSYTFDGFGRVHTSTQQTGSGAAASAPYTFVYSYSASGDLRQIQYPSGRKVEYVPDTAGRLATIKNATTSQAYASLTYNCVFRGNPISVPK